MRVPDSPFAPAGRGVLLCWGGLDESQPRARPYAQIPEYRKTEYLLSVETRALLDAGRRPRRYESSAQRTVIALACGDSACLATEVGRVDWRERKPTGGR